MISESNFRCRVPLISVAFMQMISHWCRPIAIIMVMVTTFNRYM